MARVPTKPAPRTHDADLPLNEKQARFVREYLIDFNGTQAARRAGYSAKTAKQTAHELLQRPNVQAAVTKAAASQLAKVDAGAERVIHELQLIAFGRVTRLYDKKGNIIPFHKLADAEAALIAGTETIIKNAKAGDGVVDEVLKIKTPDRVKALEILAKYHKLLTDQVIVTNDADLIANLQSARTLGARADHT
jgi:phage terminase small subunit